MNPQLSLSLPQRPTDLFFKDQALPEFWLGLACGNYGEWIQALHGEWIERKSPGPVTFHYHEQISNKLEPYFFRWGMDPSHPLRRSALAQLSLLAWVELEKEEESLKKRNEILVSQILKDTNEQIILAAKRMIRPSSTTELKWDHKSFQHWLIRKAKGLHEIKAKLWPSFSSWDERKEAFASQCQKTGEMFLELQENEVPEFPS